MIIATISQREFAYIGPPIAIAIAAKTVFPFPYPNALYCARNRLALKEGISLILTNAGAKIGNAKPAIDRTQVIVANAEAE